MAADRVTVARCAYLVLNIQDSAGLDFSKQHLLICLLTQDGSSFRLKLSLSEICKSDQKQSSNCLSDPTYSPCPPPPPLFFFHQRRQGFVRAAVLVSAVTHHIYIIHGYTTLPSGFFPACFQFIQSFYSCNPICGCSSSSRALPAGRWRGFANFCCLSIKSQEHTRFTEFRNNSMGNITSPAVPAGAICCSGKCLQASVLSVFAGYNVKNDSAI